MKEQMKKLDIIDENHQIRHVTKVVLNMYIERYKANNNPLTDVMNTKSPVDIILAVCGINVEAVDELGAVARVIDMEDGVKLTHIATLAQSIATAQRDEA